MPLDVEDGTGHPNGDSWITEADATIYFTDRNVTSWISANATVRDAALRSAADYLLFAYRWPGQPTHADQRLPWPRTGVKSGTGYYPPQDIPTQVIDAQLQLALESLSTDILRKPDPSTVVTEELKEVKGIKKQLKYATSPIDPVSGLQRFPLVDQILRGIALGSNGADFAVVPLVR